MSDRAVDAAVHRRLVRTLPAYEPNTLLSHWVSQQEDPRIELRPGTVLRAKSGDASDAWYYVKVTGPIETGRDRLEYGLTPLLTFGEIVSAPARGDGGILATYEVLSSSEARAIIDSHRAPDASEIDADAAETNIEAARRQLHAARAEQEDAR